MEWFHNQENYEMGQVRFQRHAIFAFSIFPFSCLPLLSLTLLGYLSHQPLNIYKSTSTAFVAAPWLMESPPDIPFHAPLFLPTFPMLWGLLSVQVKEIQLKLFIKERCLYCSVLKFCELHINVKIYVLFYNFLVLPVIVHSWILCMYIQYLKCIYFLLLFSITACKLLLLLNLLVNEQ